MSEAVGSSVSRSRGGRLRRLLEGLAFALLASLIRLHTATLRIRVEGIEHLEERLARGLPAVLAGWHQRLYLGIGPLRRLRPVIMISMSRDGERIARVAERLGWYPVRGSSSRGGRRGLVEMVRQVSEGALGAHVVDGPRGPARAVKPGIVALAQRTGAGIIPVYPSARRRWEARSWDRFQVPLPFTRVLLRFGRPLEAPSPGSPAADEAFRQELEKTMERGYADVDRCMREL